MVLAGGSGPDALIAPEMEAFGELFGMCFIPHAIGHSDRKGRIERPFSYIEGNFLAGRSFRDWADLNTQARNWCDTYANAKQKAGVGDESAGGLCDGETTPVAPAASISPPVTPDPLSA